MTSALDVAIDLRGLEKSYKDNRVLREVDLGVAHSSICALLGSNGAGRTTVVRILATLLAPDSIPRPASGYGKRSGSSLPAEPPSC